MTPHALLCTRDPFVIEAVQVCAAALQVDLRIVSDAAGLDSGWAGAAVRLLGADSATRWGPVRPGEAFVVGTSSEELTRCSAELGIPVIPLPDGAGHLATVISRAGQTTPQMGRIVALLGASGGLGVSTLVSAVALIGAKAGEDVVAVDLAPASGGIDLVVGAETSDGVRWPDLARARGELGDLTSELPQVGGAAFLSHGRGDDPPPTDEATRVVLAALARSAALTLVDAGRGPVPVMADLSVLVVGADVRSVAAAQMAGPKVTGMVVRSGPGRRIPPEVVARTLGLELMGAVGHDKAVPRLAELGMPPVPGPARRLKRDASSLWRCLRDA